MCDDAKVTASSEGPARLRQASQVAAAANGNARRPAAGPRDDGLGIPRLDRASVEHRLITMRKAIGQLDAVGPVDRARLERHPPTGLGAERILALLDDLAFAINTQVCAAVLGEVPPTSAASFGAAEKAGLIDAELANRLVPSEGPHYVLLQLYLDSEPDEVAAVVADALNGYGEYVRQVSGWAAVHAPQD